MSRRTLSRAGGPAPVAAGGAASAPPSPDSRVWASLWVVYLVWGSTYLAIRIAVHPAHGAGLPPLLMAGVRFALSGALLLAVTVRRPAGDGQPDRLRSPQWRAAAVVGVALLAGGNGLVTVAERRVPSGLAALVIATVPIWGALVSAATGRERLTARHAVGLVLGLGGVAALAVGQGHGRADPAGVGLLVLAALSWALGSFYAQRAPLPRRPLVSTGAQMLCGAGVLVVVGAATGETAALHPARVATPAWLALGYLVLFGGIVAYSAYVFLLRNAPLSLATTYAYVNPLVAVLLGALILGEPFTVRTVLATVLTILGVLLIVTRRPAAPAAQQPPAEARQECRV